MKSIRFACVTFAVALIGAACGGSTSSDTGSSTPDGGGGASGSAGGAGATTDGGAQPDGSAGQGAGGGAAGTGGSSGAGGAGGGAAGAGGGFDAGGACNDCLSTNCSKEMTACQADSACACWLGCFDGNNFQQCYGQCGQSQAALGFIQCGGQKCGQTCGGGQGGGGGGGQGGFGAGGQGGFGAGGQGGFGAGGASDGGVSPGCQGCLQQSCGTQLTACQASATCQCYEACLPGGDYAGCYQQCGMPDSASTQLGTCVQSKCGSSCP